MNFTQSTNILTHTAVLTMLEAAVKTAAETGQPQCIVIVDASGELLGEIRMTGAKFLSRKSASSKARTAASIGAETTAIPDSVQLQIAAATGGEMTGLGGGLPIILNEALLGGIGVGSGSPEQDIKVARSALVAIGAKI